jgi:threonine synthase
VPQIVYYVYAYATLVKNEQIKNGDLMNVTVPTGNFGNILAAYYAKLIGIPIDKLICASNKNKVLFDFFTTGTYDKKREFMVTSSPSMDILISSNLERLIYRLAGDNAAENAAMMQALSGEGEYTITEAMKKGLADFYGNYADEDETSEAIKNLYEKTGYVIDTHTAVAASVYKKYVADTKDTKPTVIASTASPYKFARSVMTAIDAKYQNWEEFELVDELAKLSNVPEPEAVKEIRTAPVRHNHVCEVNAMEATVKQWLGIK